MLHVSVCIIPICYVNHLPHPRAAAGTYSRVRTGGWFFSNTILQLLAGGLGDGGMSKTLILKASEIGTGLPLLKNSRENELQADAEGVKIMYLARYNPRAMIDIQTMLLKMSKGNDPPAIISTHPPSRERIQAIRQAIKNLK